LCGLVVAYLAVASLSYFDIRYVMPAVVYVAVLGGGWIALLRRPARLSLTILLASLFVLNTMMISTGTGREIAVALPGGENRLVIISDRGYVEGAPEKSRGFREILAETRRAGTRTVLFDGPSLNVFGSNLNGLAVLAFTEGLSVKPGYEAASMGPSDVFMRAMRVGAVRERPCLRLSSGRGLYLYKGGPPSRATSYCP
jgi:hypothetical protein